MTKIDIFSGFLGAGKTTLIKKLIAEAYKGEKVVLIENEFGEIGIDGGFLRDAGIEITEMNSGCICCSLVGDFGKALKKVIAEIHPDRILIEPSGVGKLSDVIRAVQNASPDGAVLNGFTTVADVNKCKMYMKNFGEFFDDQIKNAGCIVLSRTGGAKQEKIDEAVALLRAENPTATIVTTDWEKLDGKKLLETMERKNTIEAELARLAEETEHECDDDCDHDHDHEHEHEHHHHEHEHEHGHDCPCCHHHDDDDDDDDDDDHDHCHDEHHHHHHHHHADEVFTSFGRETAKKFTADEISAILDEFSESDKYGTVLRAKGIVEGEDGKWIHFDYVPSEKNVRCGTADVTGRICVIGAKLDEDAIARRFGV